MIAAHQRRGEIQTGSDLGISLLIDDVGRGDKSTRAYREVHDEQ